MKPTLKIGWCIGVVLLMVPAAAAQEPATDLPDSGAPGEVEFEVDHFREDSPEPFYVVNAMLRGERMTSRAIYWHPIRPRQPAEVVYRFESPFPVVQARLKAILIGYQSFDALVEGRVEVSGDGQRWTVVKETSLDLQGPMYLTKFVVDVSEALRGATTIYVRGWMKNSLFYPSLGVPQWLRQDLEGQVNPSLRLWLAADSDAIEPEWVGALLAEESAREK
jgi:hypothetical protein